MANVKSAEKRNRQRIKRRATNVAQKSSMRSKVKTLRAELDADPAKAKTDLPSAIKAVDKAAQKGVIKKQTAARMISRMTRAVARATAK